jgi:hypothetical protein
VRGRVEIRVGGKDPKVVEIIRRSTVVPDRELELSKVVERGDLFQVDLESRGCIRTHIQTLEELRE